MSGVCRRLSRDGQKDDGVLNGLNEFRRLLLLPVFFSSCFCLQWREKLLLPVSSKGGQREIRSAREVGAERCCNQAAKMKTKKMFRLPPFSPPISPAIATRAAALLRARIRLLGEHKKKDKHHVQRKRTERRREKKSGEGLRTESVVTPATILNLSLQQIHASPDP